MPCIRHQLCYRCELAALGIGTGRKGSVVEVRGQQNDAGSGEQRRSHEQSVHRIGNSRTCWIPLAVKVGSSLVRLVDTRLKDSS